MNFIVGDDVLDCGGKRSATPLSDGNKAVRGTDAPARPPFIVGDDVRSLTLRNIKRSETANERFWTAAASAARRRFRTVMF